MSSTRKESVRRHSRRFHPREETFVVPLINYLAGLRSGIYPPRSPFRYETNKSQDLADRMAEEFGLEMVRQSARRFSDIGYSRPSTPSSGTSLLQVRIQDDSLFGLSASTCRGCSGSYLAMVLFAEQPETVRLQSTHETATCPGRQFPALGQNGRNQINNTTKEAMPSILYGGTIHWTKGKPCLIALKLPKRSESAITIVRKNNYKTNSLTFAKPYVGRVSMPPTNTDLGLFFTTAITKGKIGLSDQNVMTIIEFVRRGTFWLLEITGHGEYFMAIVPDNGSDTFYIGHPEGKSDVQAESRVKSYVPSVDYIPSFYSPQPNTDYTKQGPNP